MPEADELLCLAKLPVIGYRSDSYRTLTVLSGDSTDASSRRFNRY